MDVDQSTLQVNKFARRSRHMRIFSRKNIVKMHAADVLKTVAKPFGFVKNNKVYSGLSRFFGSVKAIAKELIPASPQKRLLFQASLISVGALVVTSVTPGGTLTAASMDYSSDYISSYSLPGDVLVSDEDGYLIKINPQTDNSNRVGLTDYAVHTIESGETLSLIAARYEVDVSTIMWENGLKNANSIRSGQKLMVPPVDGVSYEVKSGDNLDKIADKYKISSEAIIAQNALESETLVKGQSIFLPGAEPIYAPTIIAADGTPVSVPSVSRAVSYANAAPATSTPAVGKIFIYPTRGKITQGYHAGHYAIDISDTSKPPVWAPGGGTVTKVSTGTWCGGYGNHVVIDHCGGLKSLYAHLDSVNVYQGQYVGQGEVIGIMGNTGRVYGVTGIHLHWEVIQDGVKQYPGNYY